MSEASLPRTGTGNEPWVEVTGSPRLWSWLAEQRVSLAFTTYQTGKLFLLGRHADGRLAVFERTFNRAMGLWADGQTLWLSTLYQLWRFENLLRPGELHQGYDRLYVPKVANTTGDLDIHDIAVDHTGRVVFVATGFGCLGTLAERSSFTPLWRPPFLSKLAAEDRCHLNGLALDDGRPRFVTVVSASDVVDGWRDRRRDGGVVVEIPDGRVIAAGLSMPHSPRLLPGPAVAAQFRHRPFRQHRPVRRRVRAADVLPRLSARARIRGRLRRRGPVADRATTRRSAAWRWMRSWPDEAPSPAAACR